MPVDPFADLLQRSYARIVLSYTNVAEIVPHNETVRADRSRVRHLFEQIERIPHIYIRSSDFTSDEFRVALCAFESGQAVAGVDPFFDHWWEAVWVLPPSIARWVEPAEYVRYLDQASLAEQVEMLIDEPRGLRFEARHGAALAAVMAEDREVWGSSRGSSEALEGAIGRRLKWHGYPIPKRGIKEFAKFIRQTPAACPGWRAGFDVWEEYRCNLQGRTQTSDIPDMAHVECLPYVSHATLDRAWRARCRQARDRLRKSGFYYQVFDRVYENTDAILTELKFQGSRLTSR